MLKYRCRILFTTRNRYENHITQEVTELNQDTLLELVGKFYLDAEKKGTMCVAILRTLLDFLTGARIMQVSSICIPWGPKRTDRRNGWLYDERWDVK